jgi:hypothetical protein
MESVSRVLLAIRQAEHLGNASQRIEVFQQLMKSLTLDHPIHLSRLDALGYDDCQLALQAILDWRIARHYAERL